MHKYAQQQDAQETGIDLDVQRAAVASTVSKPGHELFMAYRRLLESEGGGKPAKADPVKVRRSLRSKLIASGAVPVEKG